MVGGKREKIYFPHKREAVCIKDVGGKVGNVRDDEVDDARESGVSEEGLKLREIRTGNSLMINLVWVRKHLLDRFRLSVRPSVGFNKISAGTPKASLTSSVIKFRK